MKKLSKIVISSFIAVVMISLSACGGSSSSDNPPSNSDAEGLWVGSSDNDQGVTGLVLDDGTYYVLYSAEGDPSLIAGVVQGNSTTSGDNFSSTNAKDFNIEGAGVLSATVSGTVIAKQSFNGAILYTDGSSTNFTTTYSSDYELAPSLSALAGTYTGTVAFSLGFEDAIVTISQDGTFSGAGASGCEYSGSVSPRESGNVFNGSISFSGYPCYFESMTLSGIAYFDNSKNRLYVVAPTSDRNEGVLFVGTKP